MNPLSTTSLYSPSDSLLSSSFLLEARELSASYSRRTALFSNVSLFIRPGSFTIIRGLNGVGKSTLLRILAGSAQSRSGSIQRAPGLRTGYVSGTQRGLYGDLSLDEHLALLGVREIDEQLAALGVPLNRKMRATVTRKLSSGEQALISFCFVMLRAPNLLLADELTAHLDLQRRELVDQALQRFRSLGGAVVSISHDSLNAQSSDRVVCELTSDGLRGVA